MPERIVFLSQIELSAAASTPKESMRKQEHDEHVNNGLRHLPPGGLIGQVVVMTSSGLAWKWPSVICGCGPASITFEETPPIMALQGIDFNVIREVKIV
jgi:hypothetical protein